MSLEDKTYIVTGATAGLGRACAEQLAASGARIVIVARNETKAADTCEAITAATGNASVEFVRCDFEEQASIRQAGAQLLERCERIDLLLNNAGVTNLRRETTVDGFETTFAVNHLGYFLLTNLLAERIAATPDARVVSISSDAHKLCKSIDFDDLQNEGGYKWMDVYGKSKGANLLFTRELARRLEPAGVTAHAIHPGFVRSSLGANNGTLGRVLIPIVGLFAMSADTAAGHVVAVCTEPHYAESTGGYFYKRKPHEIRAWAASDENAARLWDVSQKLTGLDRTA